MASGDTTKGKGKHNTRASGNTTPKRGQNGGGRPPVDSKTRARVRKLAREGKSRNAIAREVGISTSTVTTICAAARPPITFDRKATKAATAARVADLKAERAKIAQRLTEEVHRTLDKLTSKHTVHHFDKDGVLSTGQLDGPTSGDVKNYMTSIGIALDKILVIERHDSDDSDLPAVDKWIAFVLGGDA